MLSKAAFWIYLGFFAALIAAGLGFPIPEELPIVGAGVTVGHVAKDTDVADVAPEILSALAAAPDLPFPANLPWAGLVRSTPIQQSQDGIVLARGIEVPAPEPPPVPLRWWIMLPLLILGVIISDGLLYGLGRFWGPRLLDTRLMRRLIPPAKRQRIEENFHKYGVLVLLFARFLPTIRSPIYIMAGTMRLPFTRFVLADGLYAIPGVSLLFSLAFWFGDQFRELVLRAEHKVALARPVLILLGIAAVAAYLVYHFFRHPVATGDPRDELPVIGTQVAAKMKCPGEQPPLLKQGEWVCPDGSKPTELVEFEPHPGGPRDNPGAGDGGR